MLRRFVPWIAQSDQKEAAIQMYAKKAMNVVKSNRMRRRNGSAANTHYIVKQVLRVPVQFQEEVIGRVLKDRQNSTNMELRDLAIQMKYMQSHMKRLQRELQGITKSIASHSQKKKSAMNWIFRSQRV